MKIAKGLNIISFYFMSDVFILIVSCSFFAMHNDDSGRILQPKQNSKSNMKPQEDLAKENSEEQQSLDDYNTQCFLSSSLCPSHPPSIQQCLLLMSVLYDSSFGFVTCLAIYTLDRWNIHTSIPPALILLNLLLDTSVWVYYKSVFLFKPRLIEIYIWKLQTLLFTSFLQLNAQGMSY